MENKNLRQLKGTVVSDKMVKTIVVAVSQTKRHPKYLKQYTMTKRFKVHDENRKFHIGDKVSIVESRPLSKTKRWVVLENNSL